MSFLCLLPLFLHSSLASSLFQQLNALPPDVCTSICYEKCSHCNDQCLANKTGECAACWTTPVYQNYTCLSATDPTQSCAACWQERPCDVCRTGSCARCEKCQGSKAGGCASCYQEDSANFTCLLDTSEWTGKDCKGCWNVNHDAMPVVITSGLTASVLRASWRGLSLCKDQVVPITVWPLNLTDDVLCHLEALQVVFDETTGIFTNKPGVNVTIVDFGGFDGLTYGPIYKNAMEQLGYRAGLNLFGAPFDWRLPGQAYGSLYRNLTNVIELAYNKSNGKKVALIAPSFGPQVTLGFLNNKTTAWKDKHIEWFIADSPVWSGSPTALFALTSGFPLLGNKTGIGSWLVRELAQALPSLYWLVPEPGHDEFTYSEKDILVTTPSKNYSAFDVAQLLDDIGAKMKVGEFDFIKGGGSLYKFAPPNVNTYVVYGYGLPTAARFAYDQDFGPLKLPSLTPRTLTSSGDGIVAVRASRRGELWTARQKAAGKALIHAAYPNLDHAACVFNYMTADGDRSCYNSITSLLINRTMPAPRPLPPQEGSN